MSINTNYDFDNNNQDDVIFNGVDSIHSIDEFNVVFESLSDTFDVSDNDDDYNFEDLR